jgi:hypothetical protein
LSEQTFDFILLVVRPGGERRSETLILDLRTTARHSSFAFRRQPRILTCHSSARPPIKNPNRIPFDSRIQNEAHMRLQ